MEADPQRRPVLPTSVFSLVLIAQPAVHLHRGVFKSLFVSPLSKEYMGKAWSFAWLKSTYTLWRFSDLSAP